MEVVDYEQCEWYPQHVAAIYRSISPILDDGTWHAYGPSGRWAYRVWNQRIFQSVSRRGTAFEQQIMACDPPLTDEDAEWKLVKFDDHNYGIASKFTMTYPLLPELELVESKLLEYNLGFEELDHDNFGVAYFGGLNPHDWREAMEKLCYLESICLQVNREMETALRASWNQFAFLSEPIPECPDDHVPDHLPGIKKSGPKWRQPLVEVNGALQPIDV